jgi:hypothetical protein
MSVTDHCNDNIMSTASSNGDAHRSPSPQTQVRAQQHPMELDLAPSLSRSRSNSVASAESETSYRDVNRKLTYPSSPRSRHQRPPTLPPLPNSTLNPHSVFAISGSYNNNNYYSQDVRPSLVNASSAYYRNNPSTGQNVSHYRTPESSNFQSHPSHVSINNQVTRPRTSTPVFSSTSDLAAHYGIPTSLPPAPRTTPRRAEPAESHYQPPPEPEFASLCSNYLTMLSQKPGDISMTEDPVMSSGHDSTAPIFPPAVTQEDAVNALMEVLQGDSHCRCTACAVALTPLSSSTASPQLQMSPDFSEYLTSPYDDSPFDDDLLTTPAMGSVDMGADILTSPIIDDWNRGHFDEPIFNEAFETLFPVSKPLVDTAPPLTVSPAIDLDLNGMWTISPQTPSLDQSMFKSPSVQSSKPLPTSRRKVTATGTRKNVTPETLVPVDAPTQPRKYITPSSTSRKEVPAVFARKRARSQAFGDEEDQLEDELYTLPPNPTEQELIEAKRRQNTIAARRSRKRKLEYQRELEDSVEAMKEERDQWKSRALTCSALLKSHGLESPDFCDA